MMKQAWRSYIASLHPRYLRKAYDNGAIFPLIYWFVIYPIIMDAVTNEPEFYDLVPRMVMRLIPFLIMGWSNINSKYLMPKAMFIAPMKEQERMEYINDVLIIKIGVAILLSFAIEVVWGLCTEFHAAKIILMPLVVLSMGIAIYIESKKNGMNAAVSALSIILMFFVGILEIGAEGSLVFVSNWFILITVIILPVLDVLIVKKKYKDTIARAGDYELAFKIEGKVELKQVKFDLFAKKE